MQPKTHTFNFFIQGALAINKNAKSMGKDTSHQHCNTLRILTKAGQGEETDVLQHCLASKSELREKGTVET